MRNVLLAVLATWLVAPPASGAERCGEDEACWVGKGRVEVVAEWGEPTRVKQDRHGGSVLIYDQRFYDHEDVRAGGETTYRSAGVGPVGEGRAAEGSTEVAKEGGVAMQHAPHQALVATRKARFFLDASGVVERARIRPMKWKGKDQRPLPEGRSDSGG
jgi:hypothetical protein